MARILDNIEQELLTALRATLAVSHRADFCVGYLNLRGWQAIDDLVRPWSAESGQVCRVLVGMQRPPHDEIRDIYRAGMEPDGLDNTIAQRLKIQFAAHLPIRAETARLLSSRAQQASFRSEGSLRLGLAWSSRP